MMSIDEKVERLDRAQAALEQPASVGTLRMALLDVLAVMREEAADTLAATNYLSSPLDGREI